jgi:exodeoxyribonuclease VII large subunit
MRMMSPANIMKRGFAIVTIDDRIVTNASDIEVGSNISVQLDQTDFKASVKTKTKIATHGEFDL